MNIAVAGMGYVGLANAVMLSEKHTVTITDIDENKVAMLKHKISPVQDTELQQRLWHSNLNAVLAAQCDYSKFDYVSSPFRQTLIAQKTPLILHQSKRLSSRR